MIDGNNPIENSPGEKRLEQGNLKQWRQELSGEATLTRINRHGHHLWLVAAEHFSQKAADFFQREIAEEIKDQSQWLFLIEGKDSGVHETVIASDIAKQKNIPIENPIFDQINPAVIELYLNSKEAGTLSKEIVVGQLAADVAGASGTTDLEEVAKILGVRSSSEVMLNIMSANAEKTIDPDRYLESSRKMRDDLEEISNIVSAQMLDYFLRLYNNRPNVAVYLGKAHEGIATPNFESIPERLRFNDDQIQTMLKERESRKERSNLRTFDIDVPVIMEALFDFTSMKDETPLENEEKSNTTDRVSRVLGEIPDVSDSLKTAIIHWSENLFGLVYVRKRGYREYLSSDNSLDQVWGAAAHLADMVDKAREENRSLTQQEIDNVRADFTMAAQTRLKDSKPYAKQAEELFELANGVQILEQIIRKLQKSTPEKA